MNRVKTFLTAISIIMASTSTLNASIELEVYDTAAADDDYICWSPIPARIRRTDAADPDQVTLTSVTLDADSSARVAFQSSAGPAPSRSTANLSDQLNVILPAPGVWSSFFIAGKEASIIDKDVGIRVSSNGQPNLHTHPLMVRVRKNADTLTKKERNEFLEAISRLHRVDNGSVGSLYPSYFPQTHLDAASPVRYGNQLIHNGPGFLPWHRAFVLMLERQLQANYPHVTIPYWVFDKASQNIFTPNFMGTVTGAETSDSGAFLVRFDQSNPLNGWTIRGVRGMGSQGPLVRQFNADGSSGPLPRNTSMEFVDEQKAFGFHQDGATPRRGVGSTVEFRYHNQAHNAIRGWLSRGWSPADPLFFLLHSNVDRAWAKWQKDNDTYDVAAGDKIYEPLGGYPGPAQPQRFRQIHYADEEMWPWNGNEQADNGTPNDPGDDHPGYAWQMPAGTSTEFLVGPLLVKSMLDYNRIVFPSTDLGFCYDELKPE